MCCWCIQLTLGPNCVDALVLCNSSGYDFSSWSAGGGFLCATVWEKGNWWMVCTSVLLLALRLFHGKKGEVCIVKISLSSLLRPLPWVERARYDWHSGLMFCPVSSTCRRCEAQQVRWRTHRKKESTAWRNLESLKGGSHQQQLKTNSTADLIFIWTLFYMVFTHYFASILFSMWARAVTKAWFILLH